jgi:hypothetical protein
MRPRCLRVVPVLVLLAGLAGCQGTNSGERASGLSQRNDPPLSRTTMGGSDREKSQTGTPTGDADEDALPSLAGAAGGQGHGLLLHSGAIQLGPGVGKSQWQWQGDGRSGF